MAAFTFDKSEKLCSRKAVKQLYEQGKSFSCFPLRITWQKVKLCNNDNERVQVLIWAPKSKFKRANKRNYLRRLMREAYRLNSAQLKQACQHSNVNLHLSFLYVSTDIVPLYVIENAIKKAIGRIIIQLSEQSDEKVSTSAKSDS